MQKVAILYDAGQAVLSTFDLDEVLQQILRIVRDYFHLRKHRHPAPRGGPRELYVRRHIGWDEGNEKLRVPFGTGIIGAAAREKRPIYAPDVSKDPRYINRYQETRSELAMPLMAGDHVVGVLH